MLRYDPMQIQEDVYVPYRTTKQLGFVARLFQTLVRPFVPKSCTKQMCDGCLGWQEYKMEDGKRLCKKCYEREQDDC